MSSGTKHLSFETVEEPFARVNQLGSSHIPMGLLLEWQGTFDHLVLILHATECCHVCGCASCMLPHFSKAAQLYVPSPEQGKFDMCESGSKTAHQITGE